MRPLAIDDDNRYTGLDRFGRVDDQWYLNTSTSATLDRLQYGYDRDSDVLYQNNLVNAAFSELYHANSTTTGDNNSAYDPLSRLTAFRRGTLTSSTNNGTGLDTITSGNLNSTTSVPNQNSWNLDALGNWTSGAGLSNSFNSQNEETANGSSSLAYDHNGDMTTDQAGNLYTFDAWNHLIRIANSSNSTEETFSYDALGRAVVNNNGSGAENRYYSGTNIIQEQFSSTDYAQYVYGLAYVNDVILRDRNADGNNSTGNLGITGSGLEEREYAQHDTQFSAISLTDSTGAVMQRFIYDPYGTITVLTPSWAYDTTGGGTNYWLYTFQGMRIVDAPGTTGMLFSETRIYDAGLGRWISQDPAGYVDGANRYELEAGCPPNITDPSGLAGSMSAPTDPNYPGAQRKALGEFYWWHPFSTLNSAYGGGSEDAPFPSDEDAMKAMEAAAGRGAGNCTFSIQVSPTRNFFNQAVTSDRFYDLVVSRDPDLDAVLPDGLAHGLYPYRAADERWKWQAKSQKLYEEDFTITIKCCTGSWSYTQQIWIASPMLWTSDSGGFFFGQTAGPVPAAITPSRPMTPPRFPPSQSGPPIVSTPAPSSGPPPVDPPVEPPDIQLE